MTTILDSLKALTAADNSNDEHFLSSPFTVAPNTTGHLILTAPSSRYRDVSFSILRFPQPLTQSSVASCLQGVYAQLSSIPPDTSSPHPHGQNIPASRLPAELYMTLGQTYDHKGNQTAKCYDWITINKMGNYILYGRRERNTLIDTYRTHSQPVVIEYATENS
jgi:hypothetical protein